MSDWPYSHEYEQGPAWHGTRADLLAEIAELEALSDQHQIAAAEQNQALIAALARESALRVGVAEVLAGWRFDADQPNIDALRDLLTENG